MAFELTDRQREVFDFVCEAIRRDRRPPTVREIAHAFGFRSPKAVTDHLNALERKGYIRRRDSSSRNIEIREQFAPVGIPVLGDIAAGSPILALENMDGSLSLDAMFGDGSPLFALKVRGDSMKDAGIMDGDFVVIENTGELRNGAIGAVLVGDEATVKRVFYEGSRIRLHGENPDFEDMVVDKKDGEVSVCGPVRGVVRRM